MNHRTAIIDIGSNSARLVIYEKTSRYGFHLICEQKSKVRIGEGAYQKGGYLQPNGIKRAFLTLQSFQETIQKYKTSKTLCVATSALRDAPNGNAFVSWIKKELKLDIQVIDGKKEAQYGAIAVSNLLPVSEGITIDIGGGSADLALINKGKIVDTFSLNLGTVRLKELFFDKGKPLQDAIDYIHHALEALPAHFKHHRAIGIGGTARTLSKSIMKSNQYPLDKLHAYRYTVTEERHAYFQEIYRSSAKGLKRFPLKRNRYDTIREGTLIFDELLKQMEVEEVITSSAGVREGLFLNSSLNKRTHKFPEGKNPSIESILSRFKPMVNIEKNKRAKLQIALSLYHTFLHKTSLEKTYESELLYALKLSSIGKTLTIYRSHKHAFYIAMQELNYGFTHEQIVLIALLLRSDNDGTLPKILLREYRSLLPSKKILAWLSFFYKLTILIHEASNGAKIEFTYENQVLVIYSDKSLYLAKEKIRTLKKPIPFAIIIADKNELPKNKYLMISDK
ncbi:Ppx/GppA phosphatase family protein [Sulfurovum mangrovi]|uniref:Ppx/GppA phosphatase family protein n=1 Tax=Sulfurovum mangrovi TaxID=2893889 RepID=UPI001E4040B7|nr:Ppx/GppA phosphatase family protein [Sulfurovum mangrovi]UFH58885.1 Ppx/GppA family phosphatase [Sulfurovum mangrovi]